MDNEEKYKNILQWVLANYGVHVYVEEIKDRNHCLDLLEATSDKALQDAWDDGFDCARMKYDSNYESKNDSYRMCCQRSMSKYCYDHKPWWKFW